jgi:hypothetical protein
MSLHEFTCRFSIALDQSEDRWIARLDDKEVEIIGGSREEALQKAEAWALRGMADQIESRTEARRIQIRLQRRGAA